jgi:hypothetical protein
MARKRGTHAHDRRILAYGCGNRRRIGVLQCIEICGARLLWLDMSRLCSTAGDDDDTLCKSHNPPLIL